MEAATGERSVRSLKELAYSRIASWLVSGKLRPGEPLVEMSLANRLKLGRTPVREAIQQLAQEGLVEIVPRRGAFVARTSLGDVKELFEIREVLEGTAARLATLRCDPRELAMLKRKFQEAERERDSGRRRTMLERTGDDLHDYILKTCGNKRIIQIISNYKLLLQRERHHAATIRGRIDSSAKEHKAILDALIRADPDGAEEAMRRHIASTAESILTTLVNTR